MSNFLSFPPVLLSPLSVPRNQPLLDEKHACVPITREKMRKDGERKRGNRDTIGPEDEEVGRKRKREEGKFSVCTITTGISSNAPLLPTFLVSTSLMFLYRSGKGVESGRDGVEEG